MDHTLYEEKQPFSQKDITPISIFNFFFSFIIMQFFINTVVVYGIPVFVEESIFILDLQ
jgi:hypothetical protein